MTTEPTDAELKAMWQLHAADIGGIFCYARAVLAKWGQPAQPAPAPMSPANRLVAYSAATRLRELGFEWDATAEAWLQPAPSAQAADSVQEDAAESGPLSDEAFDIVTSENQVLKAKLAALEVLYLNSLADATQWQLYKSRKDAVIAAGMGKKVMRDSAAGAAPGNIVGTKTQAGQIVAVTRQNDEGQIIEVIAESAGAAPVHKEPVAWRAWNSQHHCYDYGEASETDALGRVVEYLCLEGEV